jgi:hypothetical protein
MPSLGCSRSWQPCSSRRSRRTRARTFQRRLLLRRAMLPCQPRRNSATMTRTLPRPLCRFSTARHKAICFSAPTRRSHRRSRFQAPVRRTAGIIFCNSRNSSAGRTRSTHLRRAARERSPFLERSFTRATGKPLFTTIQARSWRPLRAQPAAPDSSVRFPFHSYRGIPADRS